MPDDPSLAKRALSFLGRSHPAFPPFLFCKLRTQFNLLYHVSLQTSASPLFSMLKQNIPSSLLLLVWSWHCVHSCNLCHDSLSKKFPLYRPWSMVINLCGFACLQSHSVLSEVFYLRRNLILFLFLSLTTWSLPLHGNLCFIGVKMTISLRT